MPIYLGNPTATEAKGDLLTVARIAGCKCYRPSDRHCALVVKADIARLDAMHEAARS